MKLAVAALAGCALLSAASACGNGGVEDGVTFVVEADLSDLPQGSDSDEAMDDFREVMERRLKAADADFEIRTEGSNRLTVTVAGVAAQETSELLGQTGWLEFRAPVMDDSGQIVCENTGTAALTPSRTWWASSWTPKRVVWPALLTSKVRPEL